MVPAAVSGNHFAGAEVRDDEQVSGRVGVGRVDGSAPGSHRWQATASNADIRITHMVYPRLQSQQQRAATARLGAVRFPAALRVVDTGDHGWCKPGGR
ncbi:MAG: hypothetical protein NVS3B21_33250 [Acidimicrobiales bacterium]